MTMGRLFWKIFLTFWLTLILVLIASNWGTALYWQATDNAASVERYKQLVDLKIQAITDAVEYDGLNALKKAKRKRHSRKHPPALVEIDIFDAENHLVHQEPRYKRRHTPSENNIIKNVTDPQGNDYKIVAKYMKNIKKRSLIAPILRPYKDSPGLLILWLSIAALVSGAICFWLAWYLTHPLRYLQNATRQLAAGNLDMRVAQSMGNRHDEITDLGKDFDHMAERLQMLILSQKQLLSDISHELRSPLARLQIAAGLTRQKTGNNATKEIDRIEREVTRLDELVGQVLTLSRLETGSETLRDDYVDIMLLLEEIVQDAKFESTDQRQIRLQAQQSWTLKANAELLHRALENIIRNAMHYTHENTQVTVNLEQSPKHENQIRLTICDQGSGIPEDQLTRLFEPFVRISNSRSRNSGGYGLGLAIAERSIHLHEGKIYAKNRDEGGLCVTVLLPITS